MSTLVFLATADLELAGIWANQLPPGRTTVQLGTVNFPNGSSLGFPAVVLLDATAEGLLPPSLLRCPTIFVGEPGSVPFEQAKLAGRARVYLSYAESRERLRDFLMLVEELAEKQSMLDLLLEKSRRPEPSQLVGRPQPSPEATELWEFLEGAVENLDSRDRLIAEFRRASRQLLRASHTVFFLREGESFRADRGTSFFLTDDPIVSYFESHPTVMDGTVWEIGIDPVAELAVRKRLALWGARLLVPVHDNGRLLGLIAFGVRDDGKSYDDADRTHAVFLARLLRHCLGKAAHWGRLGHLVDQAALGSKYLPNTLVLGPDEPAPRNVPLVVRDLIGKARRAQTACRISPAEGQPFRAGAGLIVETGGIWAFWQEASGEFHDAAAQQRAGRRGLLRDLALTLSHELGNALVSLVTLRQLGGNLKLPNALLETAHADIARLEALNRNLGMMQVLHEASGDTLDMRELAKSLGKGLGINVEVGPDAIQLCVARPLIEFGLRSLIETIVENRSGRSGAILEMQLRSSGEGAALTALLSIKGKHLELEGVLPEVAGDQTPNQGRLGVLLAKEILRLHHGEIHAGPGINGTEIMISFRSC